MEIVRADVDDAKQIIELQRKAYYSEAELHDDFNIPPLTQTSEELVTEFQRLVVLKVIKGGEVWGSGQVRLDGETAHIGRMAIWPHMQGRGIGSRLLFALENVFDEARRIELFTGEKSEANLGMYKRRGYTPFRKEKLGKTTIIFLEKFL